MRALKEVGGDLSDNGAKFREALAKEAFETPTGPVKLDHNRQAIATIFVTEVAQGPNGGLVNNVVSVTPDVNQTLGEDPAAFVAKGAPSRTNPECP